MDFFLQIVTDIGKTLPLIAIFSFIKNENIFITFHYTMNKILKFAKI